MADRGPVRVEFEVRRKVIRGQVIEAELTGFDQLHHLGSGHRFRRARDRELSVDRHVSNVVSLARRPAPCAVGRHDGCRYPGWAGPVFEDRLQLRREVGGDRVFGDGSERLGREAAAVLVAWRPAE